MLPVLAIWSPTVCAIAVATRAGTPASKQSASTPTPPRVGNSSAPLLSEFRDGRWAASVSRAREWEWAVAWSDEPCAVGCRSPRIPARSWRKRVAWPSPEAGVGGGWPKRGERVRQARRRARFGREALRRGANVGAPLASGNRAGRGAGPFEAPRWVRSASPAAGAGFADGSGTP